jgi:hypothetical protein
MSLKTMKQQRAEIRLQRIVDDFNARFPVGTRVFLRKDSGPVVTTVSHAAVVLGGHSAVAWFEGVSGCYDVENRVSPLTAAKAG